MLNKLLGLIRQYEMLAAGDHVICAVSGGADSMALLFGLYLLKEKLKIRLSAAHYNHHLRGSESDGDEMFVRDFCKRYDIPLFCSGSAIQPNEKGLEAAARDARYAFFATLPGKIATAHTADDNAETVLMHLVRGTGLKGLGAIAPIRGSLIRPMLSVTRGEVLDFLGEWNISYREDSSNAGDDYLRNRLRHHVMPALYEENPKLAENLSAMALRLRADEELLSSMTPEEDSLSVLKLRQLHPALRYRALERFLKRHGVGELEADHIALLESLVFSPKPSARAVFPGGVTIGRSYDQLERICILEGLETVQLACPGRLELSDLGLTVICEFRENAVLTTDSFTVRPAGPIFLRSRQSGDEMRLSGGTKSLKKIFIDRKIPAHRRNLIPVIADNRGVLGVWGIGANLDRTGPGMTITFIGKTQQDAEK